MERKIVKLLPAIIVAVLLLVLEAAFMLQMKHSGLFPARYMVILGIALFLLTGLCGFLLYRLSKWQCLIPGILLALIFVISLLLAMSHIRKGVNTLLGIVRPEAATTAVDILVRYDDPAQDILDVEGYVFGVLSTLDRENSDKALEELEEQLGQELQVRFYEDLDSLVGALRETKEVGAILLNDGFWQILREAEIEQNVPDKFRLEQTTRVLYVVHVEEELPTEPTPPATTEPPKDQLPIFTVYISGSDSRYGLTYRSNSDVNIIAVFNPNTKQMLLVSTPRDYYIPLSISGGVKDKLTHAGVYGVEVSMDTLSMLYDTEIDYYFKVHFDGFKSIVDALGGVTVESDVAFTTSSGFQIVKGKNILNGTQALEFAWERKAFTFGDRQRGENQMKIISGVAEKLLSSAILANYSELLASMEKNFHSNIPYDLIASLVREQLDYGGKWEIISYSVDGTDDERPTYTHPSSNYVMIPDEETVEHAKALINTMKSGQLLPVE